MRQRKIEVRTGRIRSLELDPEINNYNYIQFLRGEGGHTFKLISSAGFCSKIELHCNTCTCTLIIFIHLFKEKIGTGLMCFKQIFK